MAAKTNYLEDAYLNHTLRAAAGGPAFVRPAHVYLGLFTSDPGEAGVTTGEVVGNAYGRQEVIFGAPSGGAVSNIIVVTFAVATGSWGLLSHIAYFDSLTGGNALYYGALSAAKTVGSGDQASFAIGSLIVSEDLSHFRKRLVRLHCCMGTRGRVVGSNRTLFDQADFFAGDGFTRVTNLTPADLTLLVYYNNTPQPWVLTDGTPITDERVVSGFVYFTPLTGGPYAVRWRPNALGYWRIVLSYAAGLQIVALDYDVFDLSSPGSGAVLVTSFVRPGGGPC